MKQITLSNGRIAWLVLLRVGIGWHFMFEGLVKIFNPAWSPFGFLMDSKGFFAPFFHSLASNPQMLDTVGFLNEWGLLLIGLGLVTGFLTKPATWAGMVLLLFYYLSHPPLGGLNYALPNEGSYFLVDKLVIEILALGVLAVFPTGHLIGLDRLIFRKNKLDH